MVGGVCVIISIHQLPEMATSSISDWHSSFTKSSYHTHSSATPGGVGLLTLAYNGLSYLGPLNTSGRALRYTLPTNKPTKPPAHTPINQPINPPIRLSTEPSTHPSSQPHPAHHPTTYTPIRTLVALLPTTCKTFLFTTMWKAIHESIKQSMIQSHIAVLATLGWNGCSHLHSSISYVAHLRIAGQAHRCNLPH